VVGKKKIYFSGYNGISYSNRPYKSHNLNKEKEFMAELLKKDKRLKCDKILGKILGIEKKQII